MSPVYKTRGAGTVNISTTNYQRRSEQMSGRDRALARLTSETAIHEEIASKYGVCASADAVQSLTRFLQALAEEGSASSTATVRRYRQKILSYLAWHSRFRSGSPLCASLEDAENYAHFLRDPPRDWLGNRGSRSQNDKSPFRRPLTEPSVQQYVRVVKRFLEHATDYGFVGFSKLVRSTGRIDRSYSPVGYLDESMWDALWRVVLRAEQVAIRTEHQDTKRRVARIRWILEATYLAALRTTELAPATTRQLRRGEEDANFQYALVVATRGRRQGAVEEIPLVPEFVDGLGRYYRLMGRDDGPLFQRPATPLVLDLAGRESITPRNITGAIGRYFIKSRDLLVFDGNNDAAHRMQQANPQWLRNTRIVHMLDAYADDPEMYPVIQRLARTSLRRFHATLDMSSGNIEEL